VPLLCAPCARVAAAIAHSQCIHGRSSRTDARSTSRRDGRAPMRVFGRDRRFPCARRNAQYSSSDRARKSLSVFPKCVRSHIAPPLLLLAPLHRLLLGRRKARFAQRPAQRPQGLPIHELIQQGAEHLEALAAPLTSEEDIDDALHDAPSHDVPLAVASLRLAIALPNYIVIPRQHRILMRRYFRRRGAALAGELRN
jgi:hypothetical protein